jgi:hypothetical protein
MGAEKRRYQQAPMRFGVLAGNATHTMCQPNANVKNDLTSVVLGDGTPMLATSIGFSLGSI